MCGDTAIEWMRRKEAQAHSQRCKSLAISSQSPSLILGRVYTHSDVYINRTPTVANQGVTPYEKLFGKSPTYNHMKVFGCLCYARTTPKPRDKFDPRAERCMFLGYSPGQKGWQVYNLKTREFFVSRDVVFYEHIFPYEDKGRNTSGNPSVNVFHDEPHHCEESQQVDNEKGQTDEVEHEETKVESEGDVENVMTLSENVQSEGENQVSRTQELGPRAR